ncbi:MAG TPA: ATP-binding cassette domain-containing protein [Solirubrobacteraceae bacterium]|jgi:putative ABC transport system ATP-binding protein|nr:ATP-binding cassette domain-containing protein [Solirubrobacteraceae bacterium]
MTLLSLERVSKSYGGGAATQTALRDVSFEIAAGELVGVWGQRRSGRSTLLRVAAGIARPDAGTVYLDGLDIARDSDSSRESISYCRSSFRTPEGRLVLDQLMLCQLSRGVDASTARACAFDALWRVGLGRAAALRVIELDRVERVLIGLARSLVHGPRLLIIDEPTLGVDQRARDSILTLLRSLADEGIAVLASTGDASGLKDADRVLTLSKGELRANARSQQAEVIELRHASGS